MEKKIIRIGIFERPEELETAAFRDYWHYHHAPLAVKTWLGMQRYNQNHVVRRVELGLAAEGTRECAGMSKIWFKDLAGGDEKDPSYMTMLEHDEKYLFKSMDLITCEESAYKKLEPGVPFVKYLCLLKRKPELDAKAYCKKLAETASLVLNMPGIIAYSQNDVVSRVYNDVQAEIRHYDVPYEKVPIDVALEFYFAFDERYILNDPFGSAEGARAREAFSAISAEEDCYLCNEFRII